MSVTKVLALANNGPYSNRGCEAIVRGTVAALPPSYFKRIYNVAHFASRNEEKIHASSEKDNRIFHVSALRPASPIIRRARRAVGVSNPVESPVDRNARYAIKSASICASIGGDNYSLDYGFPYRMVKFDNYVYGTGTPYVVWGASIGPFSNHTGYKNVMARHLSRMDKLFVREEDSLEYLDYLGLGARASLMADPAFLLAPVKPKSDVQVTSIKGNAIGLNLSPLYGRFAKYERLEDWVKDAAYLINRLHEYTQEKIYLIPHVSKKGNSDFEFMREAANQSGLPKDACELIPDCLNAEESKWLIGQMSIFIGARTHATIAAISSGVPTLSLGYSVKAAGINKMVFGSLDHCISAKSFSVEACIEKISDLLRNRSSLSHYLHKRNGLLRESVFRAAEEMVSISS